MTKKWKAVVIGAGGSQAQAMLRAIARAGATAGWVALDRAWRKGVEAGTAAMGYETLTADPLADGARLRELLRGTELVVNMAGPYYRTGFAVLDAAIETGTDYLDICDDADITLPMLERSAAAERAGIAAIIGMGSSPGTSNVLIRAAVDALGAAEDVEIFWTVDMADLTDAAIKHFWHCFNQVAPVAGWNAVDRRFVTFPEPVGRQMLVPLAHPEPLTVPRYLPVSRAANFGGVTPIDALVASWTMATVSDSQRGGAPLIEDAVRLFQDYRGRDNGFQRIGSGLMIDVHTRGNGLRFAAGSESAMDDSTGIPAAAGALMMLEGQVAQRGAFPPELLRPRAFFETLRRVSSGGGGLGLYRLVDGVATERLRIRDLVSGDLQLERV